MANRTVSVALKMLIGDYVGPAEKAAQSTDKIGDSATKSAAQYKRGAQQIVLGAGVAAAAGALALGKIASASMNFEKAMSGVAAVSDATASQMDQLSAAAMQAGADTAFSATQAAEGEAELAKAGVSVADILGGALKGSLDLAAAGQISVGESATIAANAMNIFGLKGSDVSMVADTLAAGANKSAADVDGLAQAMAQSGQVAAGMGLDLQDTVGVLSMFADAGLKGSDAGTSLKTALQRLAAPSVEAADTMKRLGINAFDAKGNFVGLENFAGQLQKRMSGLTQEQRANALATIFGSDAVRVANILYKDGASGVAEYTAAVNDQGAAARMAAIQQDNLAGDVEKLGGSIETALIKTGSGANVVLRGLTQQATGAVNAFGNLPGPVQAAGAGLLAVGTAGAGLVAVLGTAIPRINAGRQALQEMGRAGEIANTAIGKIGKGAAIGASVLVGVELLSAGIGKLQDVLVATVPGVNELTTSLLRANEWSDISKALGGNVEDLGLKIRHIVDPSTTQSINNLFAGVIGQAPKTLREARDQVGGLDQALAGLVSAGHGDEAARQFNLIAQAAVAGGASVDQVRQAMPLYRDALAGVANASTLAADGTTKVGQAAAGAAAPLSATEQAANQLGVKFTEGASAADVLKGAIDRLNGVSLNALDTDIAFRESLASVGEAFKANGHTIDLNTAKGRANLSAISASIKAASSHAQAIVDETGSINAGSAAFGRHIAQLRATAIAAGIPKAAVDRLIATYGRVPKAVSTKVSAPGSTQSKAQMDAATAAANRIPKTKATQVSAPGAPDAAGKMNRVTQAANGIPERENVTVTANTGGAIGRIQAIINALAGLHDRTVTVNVVRAGQVNPAGGYASGTEAAAAGWHWVGESGPELMRFRGGEQVLDAGTSAAVAPSQAPRPAGATLTTALAVELRQIRTLLAALPRAPLLNIESYRAADGVSVDLLAQRVGFLVGDRGFT